MPFAFLQLELLEIRKHQEAAMQQMAYAAEAETREVQVEIQ